MQNLRFSVLTAIIALSGTTAVAQVPIDTFESYADTAALNAAWTDQFPGSTLVTTAGEGAEGSNKFVQFTALADRRYKSGFSVQPTDAAPATIDYWYRQPLANTLNREYCNVNTTLTGTDIVAFGNYNNAGTGFFGRVNGGGGPSWQHIGGTRLANTWQHLQAVIGTNDVDYYVDGTLIGSQTRPDSPHPAYTVFFMGSSLSNTSTVDMDNVGFTVDSNVGDWDLY